MESNLQNDEADILNVFVETYKNTFLSILPNATFDEENLRKTIDGYVNLNANFYDNIEYCQNLAEVDCMNAIVNSDSTVYHTILKAHPANNDA